MSGYNTAIKILAAVIGVVGMGVLAGRLFVSPPPPSDGAPANPNATTGVISAGSSRPAPHLAKAASLPPGATPERRLNSTAPAVPSVPGVAASPVSTNLIKNWEPELDAIFAAETEDSQKVKDMFALFPRLPAEGQEEVAQHLVNLVPDEEYAPLGQILTNSALPHDVLEVVFSDLLNRPNGTKLPGLITVAQDPKHVMAGEAREMLELFLDEDYGTDWAAWQTRMQEYLKDNPE